MSKGQSEMSKGLLERRGNRLRCHLHEGQARAWESRRRFTFVLAGTQSGKTTFGPIWLWREIQRRGAGDYLAVTSSYDLFRLKMLPALREWFEQTLGIGRYWASSRVLELADSETGAFRAERADDSMWGRILLRSARSDSGLESATAQAAWLDECGQDEFTLETWEAILRRLSLSQGRALGTTTPYNLGWLKTEIYDRWRAGDPEIAVVQFPSVANPAFPAVEFARAKATMPAHRFQMFYEGVLARPAGLVYESYRDELDGHLAESFAVPAEWPRYVGIDFGAVNTGLVWLAKSPETGVFWVYRESLCGGLSTPEHARQALMFAAGENVVGWYGGAPGETQQRMDWMQAGVPVLRPPVSEVESGIDRVTQLLKAYRLRVFRSCVGLRDEFGSYKRRLDVFGQRTEAIESKRAFHRLDALRYAVCGALVGEVGFGPGIWG